MTVTSILYILLVISTNYQLSVQSEDFHLKQRFNCPAAGDNNTIQIDISEHNLRSISLLSPCHPNSYYGQCVYQRRACYVVVYNIPDNMWIGLFVDDGLSVPESRDELKLLTYVSAEAKVLVNELMPGYIYRFTEYDKQYVIAFTRYPFPSDSIAHNNYKFKIDTRLAYVLGKSYGHEGSVTAGNGGYIVSHEMFDYGTDINNYYLDDIAVELTLTGLSVDDTIHLTFLFFELNDDYCDDYFEVTTIQGGIYGEHFCNSDNPLNYIYYIHPVDESITLRFITVSYWRTKTAAGFLLEYKVMKEMKCPPQIQNANKAVQVDDTEVYIIECKVSYWTENRSNIQRVDCTSDIWQSAILPCIPTECELPEISTDSELNFTLSSRGRTTVGTNISYSCNDKIYELTDGAEISTCASNGEWSSPTPNCTLVAIECELPEISTDSELNFTLSSRGTATVGANISYSCNSKGYELTNGTEISTCTSNGEWSSPTPRCSLIETTETTPADTEPNRQPTETTPAHTEPSRHTTEGNTTTMASKQETESTAKTFSSTAGYIGAGVGAAVVVILIVVVVLLLLKRRNRGTEKSPAPNNKTKQAKAKTAESIDRADIYYLATEGLGRTDMQATGRTDNTYTDVYELAEYVETPESADVSNRNDRNYEDVLTSPVDSSDISLSATARHELDVSNGTSAARAEVYELADATDNYDNHAAIERSERERDITYASVLAVNKRKFTADDVDAMVDNELYGT